MAASARQASDHPKRTPSFVCEVPLRVGPAQERTLLARLEAARQVYNACLGEARKRVRLVRASKAFQHARTLPREDPARKERFRQAVEGRGNELTLPKVCSLWYITRCGGAPARAVPPRQGRPQSALGGPNCAFDRRTRD